jgi:C-terminal peptidase prc
MIKISPSILSSNNRIESIKKLNNTNADYIHIDTMDGIFVPNTQMPIDEIIELEKNTNIPLDIHLMVNNPIEYIKHLENKNIEGLIIDVRNDTGGYLSSVTDISSLFLKKGKVIYQLEDDKNKEKIKDTTKEHREYPVAVLINSASASASEILAVSLKESYGAYVVGTNSYGKGTVQITNDLSSGGMIKFTIQKWLSPEGNWINDIGVEPTHFVELNETYYDNPSKENDNQLQKAIEVINKASN